MKMIYVLALIIFMVPLNILAQDCVDYHEVGDCMLNGQKGYKVYSQSKSVSLSLTDTVELNIVFYGQKDYILSFCAHEKMYPIHFVLINPENRQVLYDNSNDKYIKSLGIGFDVTKSILIRLDVLAREASEQEIENYLGCLGMLIQYKNYERRKLNLKMQ